MSNTINSGSLTSLQAGETLLVQARKVAGNKIQLEFAEVLKTESAPVSPLAMFNLSDTRFAQRGARRAWMTAEPSDASKILGIDISDSADWVVDSMGREIIELNILNPVAKLGDDLIPLKVEIVETTVPTEYQLANLETSAKRRGKEGKFITHKGLYIFANSRVVFHKANHLFLEADVEVATATPTGIPAGVNLSTGEIF